MNEEKKCYHACTNNDYKYVDRGVIKNNFLLNPISVDTMILLDEGHSGRRTP